MIDPPLEPLGGRISDEAVDRILMTTNLPLTCNDDAGRERLARELGDADHLFRAMRTDDRHLTSKQEAEQISNLSKHISKLISAFEEYQKAGSPRWEEISAAAQWLQAESRRERQEIRRYLSEISRNEKLAHPTETQSDKDQEESRLRARRNYLGDVDIAIQDHRAEGLIRQTVSGLNIIAALVDRVIDEPQSLGKSDKAIQWFYEEEVLRLLDVHFNHRAGPSNIRMKDGATDVGGPTIRFAMQVALELNIRRLENNRPLKKEAVASYLKRGLRRRREEGISSADSGE